MNTLTTKTKAESAPNSFSLAAASTGAVKQKRARKEGSPGNLLVADGDAVTAGQMSKSDFFTQLGSEILVLAKQILEPAGQSQDGDCPELAYWMDYYLSQDVEHVEIALARYAPGTAGATTAKECLDILLNRIKKGLEANAATGSRQVEPGPAPESIVQRFAVMTGQNPFQLKWAAVIQTELCRSNLPVHAYFNRNNLIFITQSAGRPPTLYFDNGANNHGRLRQQHDAGTLAQSGIRKYRIFIPATADGDNYNAATVAAVQALGLPYVIAPTTGRKLVEWYTNDGINLDMDRIHCSEGIVSTNLNAYTDQSIARIHNTITNE